MFRLSSRYNPIVRRCRDLARGASDGLILVDGAHLLGEALAAGATIELAAFREDSPGTGLSGDLAALAARAETAGARVYAVPDTVLAGMSPVRQPSGVVAIVHRQAWSVEQTLGPRDATPALIGVVVDVQDPGNVGAIVRAAEACGASGVVVAAGSADPFGWKAARGSMGSIFRLPVTSGTDPGDALDACRAAGLSIAAAVPRGGTPLHSADLRKPTAILLGGEGHGIPAHLVLRADQQITIPMAPPVESLNVAVAAALMFYEAQRQRPDAQ